MTNLPLVTVSSVLLQHNLKPQQLKRLLYLLQCQTYQLETRSYIRLTAKQLIGSLLASRYANMPMQDYLDKLEEKTFLYRCDSCGDLLFFLDLLLDEQQLTHLCLLERRPRRDLLGHLELVGSGPLQKLVDLHSNLFPVEKTQVHLLV